MLLQNRFNQIDSQIASVDSQIAKLQAQLSELQQHRQHLQSVEQACESALTQIDTALMMLNHIDPDCVATFKDAVLAKFDGVAIAILPESDTQSDTQSDTESDTVNPIEPTEPETDTDSEAIDVTATTETETLPETDTKPDTQSDTGTDTEPRPLASVGSSGFNPTASDLDTLKRWVRSHQGDDKTRQQGTLTRRSTWEHAAKSILSNL